jgi:P-type E1-E2 ATPase
MPPSVDFGFAADLGGKRVLVALDGRAVGAIALRETLRPDAAATVAGLRALGLRVEVLTGDPSPAWASIEGAEVRSGLSPLDKAARVRELAAEGRRVLFVGDGLNDLEGMSAAHATVAMSHAADLTRHSCDAVLVVDRLRALPEAVALARRVRRDLRVNLRLSVAYNLVGIALAAAGFLQPWLAALVMLVSSLLVGFRAVRAARPV